MRFGMKIAQLKRKMKMQTNGKPKIDEAADLRQALEGMQCASGLGDLWEEARMSEVLVFLRGGRDLQLPDWSRPLLPHSV